MRVFLCKSLVLLSIVVFLGASFPLYAGDTVLDLIEEARNAYQEQNYQLAHDLLQKALGDIQEKISTSFKPFLPEAPPGWTGEEAESSSMSYTTSTGNVRVNEAERRYVSKSDKRSVDVTITNTPEILEPYLQMSKSMPMMKGMMEKKAIKVQQEGGWYIIIEKHSPQDYKLTAVHEEVAVVIEEAESEKMANKFLEKIDLEGLAGAAKN